MNKIFTIIRKNFLILIKSRKKAVIVILSPLLTIFLAGIAFDNLNEYRLNIGVYSDTYTELTNSFITKLNTEQFRTVKAKTEAECIDDVKIGLSHACIIFPPELMLGAENKEISIYIDYSKLNLAWIVRDRLFSRVEKQATEISTELTENILSKLILTRNEISNSIPLVALARTNNEGIANMTSQTVHIFSNVTGILNTSLIDRLQSKVVSVKSASDIAVEEAQVGFDVATRAVKKADLDEEEEDEVIGDINLQRRIVIGQQKYIDNLFNPLYEGSVNNTIKDLRARVNTTKNISLKTLGTLLDIGQLTSDNIKLVKRVSFSMANLNDLLNNVDKLSAEDIATPINANIKPLTSYNTYLNFVFPTLMAIAIMLAALLLSTIVVVTELNSQAFFRNVVSPTSNLLFFFSSYLTNLLMIGIQMFIMFLISMLFFYSQIVSNILPILVAGFFIATFFVVLGMVIGNLFKNELSAILTSTFTASLLLFLSNVLMPIENMPPIFTKIIEFNPLILSVSLLRKTILFQQSVVAINEELLYLVIPTLALLLIYVVVQAITRKRTPKKSVIIEEESFLDTYS